MLRARLQPSGFIFLTVAIAAALTAFLSGAGADEDTPDSSSKAAGFAEKPSYPMNNTSDDVTSSAKAEHHNSSNVIVRVSYKHEGENQSRLFLIPKELASRMDGGLSGSLEVRSLVLASNGEPKQLILEENREGKRVHEVEFQMGWTGGASCSLIVQASTQGKWGAPNEPSRDIGLPIEDTDCRHYIFNPEPGTHDAKHSS